MKNPQNKPVAATKAKTGKSTTEPTSTKRVASCAEFTPINLFGDTIPESVAMYRQLIMFDSTDYVRIRRGVPAVVCRENGERASGEVGADTEKGLYTFTEQESGKTYNIPTRYCEVSWAGDIAIISIPEIELTRRTSLWGIFASCCLF